MRERKYTCDLLVLGATDGGVVAGVRAAREGLRTVLVGEGRSIGGVFPSLGAIETHYGGNRAPLLEEIRERIGGYYRKHYGAESTQYAIAKSKTPMLTFEPHVAERALTEMVGDERLLEVLPGYQIAEVQSTDRVIRRVVLLPRERQRNKPGGSSNGAEHASGSLVVEAAAFIDATYTGDLAASADVEYRVGRESRDQYAEPHAGRLFTRWVKGRFPAEAADGRLNLLAKATTLGLYSGSSGEGDNHVMAYSYRLCLTRDPENRVEPPAPQSYDRDRYRGIVEPPERAVQGRYPLHHRFVTQTLEEMIAGDHLFHGHALPNGKRSWNATNFPGAGAEYPDGDADTRAQIAWAHLDHALGLLHFLRHDPEVPEAVRAEAREWGFAADEFTETGHIPPELYVREARRIVGRRTFTEHDAIEARDYRRAPVNAESVAVTDFPLDSLACTTERGPGGLADGQFFLQELSRPGQVPWGVLLPTGVDNLLAPGAVSVTHVAWGAVRQSPTFMHLCESAAWGAVLAFARGEWPAELPVDLLQRTLAERGIMLSFFNDMDMDTEEPWLPAVQYFGTKGFFSRYDAEAGEALDERTARLWLSGAAALRSGQLDARSLAADIERARAALDGESDSRSWESVPGTEGAPGKGRAPGREAPSRKEGALRQEIGSRKGAISAKAFAQLATDAGVPVAGCGTADEAAESRPLTRGTACLAIYRAMEEVDHV